MSICAFWKVLCDCCIFIGIMGSLPDYFPCRIPLIIPAVGCAVTAAGACYCRKKGYSAVSVIISLLPLLLFRHAGTVKEALIFIPPVLYAVLYGILGRYDLDYRAFRRAYPRNAVILFAWAFLLLMVPDFDPNRQYLPDVAFCFGVLYLLSGVLLLQQLRMGKSCDQRSNWIQYAAVFGSFALAAGGIYLVVQLLRLLVHSYALLSSLLYREFEKPNGYFDFQKQKAELSEELYPTAPPSQPAWHHFNDAPPPVAEEAVQEEPWLLIIGIVCVLTVVAVIMLVKSKKQVYSEAKEVYDGSIFLFRKESKRPKYSNRSKIRKFYREYLRLERGRGVKLRRFMTSADILDVSSFEADSEAAKTLRQMYVSARYRENSEPTPEQVQTAKAALKQIRTSSHK